MESTNNALAYAYKSLEAKHAKAETQDAALAFLDAHWANLPSLPTPVVVLGGG